MKKQTAVEWLYSELSKNNISNDSIKSRIYKESEIWKQAKQMEKEQIKNSYLDGDSNGCGCYDWSTEEQAEDYYNETYLGIIKEEE
jgi:HEPN domain-containing protein